MKNRLTKDQISKIRLLARDGYSLKSISEKLYVSKSTVYYHAKNYGHKMTKFNVNLLDERENGYVIGLFLGDGSFNRGRKEHRFFVRFALDAKRDGDVAKRLAQIMEKAGKKMNLLSWKSNTIAKTCSKELVNYIQSYIEYTQGEKNLLANKEWSDTFKYGLIAGIIDSDGHVHAHLGTEIKTVSSKIFKNILTILQELGISANRKMRDAPSNSFSKKPRFEIYIPSAEMKRHKSEIPSAKVARYLSSADISEKD